VVMHVGTKDEQKWDPYQTVKEHLRCVTNFGVNPADPNARPGFAAGSIEGRVCIMYFAEHPSSLKPGQSPPGSNYSFRCHREGNEAYPVHDISFHPMGTFATVGGNGGICFWDKDSKQRLKLFDRISKPIYKGKFDSDGHLYAYAETYDWAQGAEGWKDRSSCVVVHSLISEEVQPKPKQATTTTAYPQKRA